MDKEDLKAVKVGISMAAFERKQIAEADLHGRSLSQTYVQGALLFSSIPPELDEKVRKYARELGTTKGRAVALILTAFFAEQYSLELAEGPLPEITLANVLIYENTKKPIDSDLLVEFIGEHVRHRKLLKKEQDDLTQEIGDLKARIGELEKELHTKRR